MNISDLKPGLFPNIPAEEYHAWPLASNSRLSDICARSPAHCRHRMLNPDHPTAALIVGSAAHATILEPATLESRYVMAGCCRAILKSGCNAGEHCGASGKALCDGEWRCLKHLSNPDDDPRIILSPDDFTCCQQMRESAMSHPTARRLLEAAGQIEVSAVFDDPSTGLRCKMRADKLIRTLSTIVDLKTTEDASPSEFSRTIFNYGYHRQAAMYLHGLNALGESYESFVIIAVEKKPPFAVATYVIDDEAIAAGRKQLDELMMRYAACEESGVWPGYSEQVVSISLPAWAQRRIEMAGVMA